MTAPLPSFDLYDNPIGTDGFEFIEYAAEDAKDMRALFESMGFIEVAQHRKKKVSLFRQGDISFFLNEEADSHGGIFARNHGPSVPSVGFRVHDATVAYEELLHRGAEPYERADRTIDAPAIRGVGGSLIYLVEKDAFLKDFTALLEISPIGHGLTYIDHITNNVAADAMNTWADFYETLFNFKELRSYDIKGDHTGLSSRAMISPCGKIRIPVNQPTDDKSQIQEFIKEYRGEGIQHIALGTNDICTSVEALQKGKLSFLTVPDAYYSQLEGRLPGHGQDIERMKKSQIALDGDMSREDKPLLLQILSKPAIGPIFFEVIQRLGFEGFGEKNFAALFKVIESDQKQRGVL